ncbi:hypothetical protein IGI04_003641, partial [Brassica rapa subsp. trilocularis]
KSESSFILGRKRLRHRRRTPLANPSSPSSPPPLISHCPTSSLFDSLSKTNATKHSQVCDLRSSLLQSDLSVRVARKSVQCFQRLFLLIREMTWQL